MNYGDDPMTMNYGSDTQKPSEKAEKPKETLSAISKPPAIKSEKMDVDTKAEESEEGEIAE